MHMLKIYAPVFLKNQNLCMKNSEMWKILNELKTMHEIRKRLA